IPPNQEPTTCHTRTTRTNKATHFFRASLTTSVVTCLCRKYYTKFIPIQNNTYQLYKEFTQIAMGKRQNSKTIELINQISQTSDNISPSSTPQLCQHTCSKCSKSITCRIYNNKYYPNKSYIFVDKKVYHTNSISTSTLLTQSIVLPTRFLANPLSNINTNKTFQTSQNQSSVKHTYSSKLKSQTNPLSSTLGPLTSTKTLQHSSMDIDNTSTNQLN
ncbi:42826_t:CDS:2, partial [Gigaspora margarita]